MKDFTSEMLKLRKANPRRVVRRKFRAAFVLALALSCWCCSRLDTKRDANTNQPPASNAVAGVIGPLIFDISGNGLDLSGSIRSSLATGRPQVTGWTTKNTDDAFLVVDGATVRAVGFEVRDKSGNPVNGLTVLCEGLRVRGPNGSETVVKDGWQMLAIFDTSADGRINSSDGVWPHLRVFTDKDADGTIGSGELASFSDANVAEVRVTNLSASRMDQFANTLVDGSFTRRDGSTGTISGVIFGARRG